MFCFFFFLSSYVKDLRMYPQKRELEIQGCRSLGPFVYLCFCFQYSGRWVIEDPAVSYVGECFAYVLL